MKKGNKNMTAFNLFLAVFFAIMIANSIGAPSGDIKVSWWRPKFDDTDDIKNKKRSGLAVYTDHGTGCQYIRAQQGGLTPRLNEKGNIVCVGKTNQED